MPHIVYFATTLLHWFKIWIILCHMVFRIRQYRTGPKKPGASCNSIAKGPKGLIIFIQKSRRPIGNPLNSPYGKSGPGIREKWFMHSLTLNTYIDVCLKRLNCIRMTNVGSKFRSVFLYQFLFDDDDELSAQQPTHVYQVSYWMRMGVQTRRRRKN